MKRGLAVAGFVCAAMAGGVVCGQSPPTTSYVTREEYDKLKQDYSDLRKELQAVKDQRAPARPAAGVNPAAGPTDQEFDEFEKELKHVRAQSRIALPGYEGLLIAGDAAIGFTKTGGTASTFSAGFSPVFLWKLNDKLLFETGLDINIDTDETGSSSTSVDLTIANLSYIINDNLTLGGGLFVVPFGVYHNHFDPPWIEKLPDVPLVFDDGGLAPGSAVGVFAVGAIPVKDWKINYALYATNGPALITTDPDAAGSLNFDNFTDANENKAIGGRIGFMPIPELEFGYSIQWGEASPNGFDKHVDALLQAVDVEYRKEFTPIYGTIDARAEWVWSHVDKATYDPTSALGFGPVSFSNNRNGGYVQLAYRPTRVENKVLRNLEFVGRYDRMNSSLSAPGGEHEQRLTFGVDYWVMPNVVLKTAYEIDDKKVGDSEKTFFVQVGIGL